MCIEKSTALFEVLGKIASTRAAFGVPLSAGMLTKGSSLGSSVTAGRPRLDAGFVSMARGAEKNGRL